VLAVCLGHGREEWAWGGGEGASTLSFLTSSGEAGMEGAQTPAVDEQAYFLASGTGGTLQDTAPSGASSKVQTLTWARENDIEAKGNESFFSVFTSALLSISSPCPSALPPQTSTRQREEGGEVWNLEPQCLSNA
jgi:hypothetical protein